MRISVYVDALNLYYGALKNTRYKWLNLVKFINLTLAEIEPEIKNLKYFTAMVSGAVSPDTPRRQRIYLNALETLPEVSVVYGNFKTNAVWRPLMSFPVADCEIGLEPKPLKISRGDFPVRVTNTQIRVIPVRAWNPLSSRTWRNKKKEKLLGDAVPVQVHSMEEKGSDVNLAAHLLNDAWLDVYDVAVVISNDRDLAEAIRLVIEDVHKEVILLCPARNRLVASRLGEVASDVKFVRTTQLRLSQFPDSIRGTRIRKPDGW